MSLKYMATEDCEWEFKIGKGDVEITDGISKKVKASGKKVLIDTITLAISHYSGQGISEGAGVGTLDASSTKSKAESKSIVLEEDESNSISVTGINSAPPPATLTVSVKVKVKKAGQSKVKAK